MPQLTGLVMKSVAPFGTNTTLPFGKKGEENPTLQKDDVFFFDLGPLFDGHEGDVGRAFAVGTDPEMHRCCEDVETRVAARQPAR